MDIYFSGDPRLEEHVRILGHIAHDWNSLENCLEVMPWLYATDPLIGLPLSRLTPRALEEVLVEISDHRENNAKIRDAIAFVIKVIRIIRENRNVLVHSSHMSATSKTDVWWVRKNKSRPAEMTSNRANLRDLKALHASIGRLNRYINDLIDVIGSQRGPLGPLWTPEGQPPRLPRRFPLPRKLVQNPPVLRRVKRQRQSSRE